MKYSKKLMIFTFRNNFIYISILSPWEFGKTTTLGKTAAYVFFSGHSNAGIRLDQLELFATSILWFFKYYQQYCNDVLSSGF